MSDSRRSPNRSRVGLGIQDDMDASQLNYGTYPDHPTDSFQANNEAPPLNEDWHPPSLRPGGAPPPSNSYQADRFPPGDIHQNYSASYGLAAHEYIPGRTPEVQRSPYGAYHHEQQGSGDSIEKHHDLASSSTLQAETTGYENGSFPTEEVARLSRRRRGYITNLIDLYNEFDDAEDNEFVLKKREAISKATSRNLKLIDPLAYDEAQILDRYDPLVTGVRKRCLDDLDDVEQFTRRQLSYKERRREREKLRIERNICSIALRQKFLITFAKALLTFGAPSHRIESELLAAARILEVDSEFTHMPGLIIATFGDEETKTSEMHFVKCGGRISLGNLHKLHVVYRAVVHDDMSVKTGTDELKAMLAAPPLCPVWLRGLFAFLIGSLICPLAFGGSFIDMWVGGCGSLFLFAIRTGIASKRSVIYANVYEFLSVIAISCVARGLSTIRSQIFCYTAISSAGVVTILPGFLILTSSMDLATKNMVCGSIKMVYALIYTLFLGFALQFGSDLFLLFDASARDDVDALAARAAASVTITGTYIKDVNSTNNLFPASGPFSFTPSTPDSRKDIIAGCYRPASFPWYLQPFPWWTQFIIVPIFSFISSFNNEQPVNLDLLVMVIISCAAYATNKVADHFIFNGSDIVSTIGAFVIGILGNTYARKAGGTAFSTMVTGVLFLVPSGLSESGGITAQANATQIGASMVSVTVGITVGLFVAQSLVYRVGHSRTGAIFSF